MKEIFGKKNLDSCIKVMLQGNEKACNYIVDFLKSIPSNVMKNIQLAMTRIDMQEEKKEVKYRFISNKNIWELTYGAGSFCLTKQSTLDLADKTVFDVYDFDDVLYSIVNVKLNDDLDIVGSFKQEKVKKIFGHNYGFDFDFFVERSYILKKLVVKTDISKIKDGEEVDLPFDRINIEKTNKLNLAKCWDKEEIEKAIEKVKSYELNEEIDDVSKYELTQK